ncbi:MAG: BspA family leucine-rich repeat surface protein, partial [Methylococcales symbiont of Iophon sp. n. MRB-2018]
THTYTAADGTPEQDITTDNPTHTYATAGDYTVTATNAITRFNLNNSADAGKLINVQQWGTANWTSMADAFYGASAMTMSASDSPDLDGVTSMAGMFSDTNAFNGDISGWNVASVTDMTFMFSNASAFNGDISGWNVDSVTTMGLMFQNASAFNQNIGGWNVASVTDMTNMFEGASIFNGDISGWNVASVTDMSNMFDNALAFNQDISGWNIASVAFMDDMFFAADSFSQNLGRWYVDEAVDDLQTANSDYDGVDNLNVLSFNFVAQNAVLSAQNPTYTLATGAAAEGTANARFTLDSNTLSINSDSVVDGSYTVRIAVGNTEFGTSNSIDLTVVVGTPLTVTSIGSFITEWQMPTGDLTLIFPSEGSSYSIDWGDGITQAITANNPTHTYAAAGDYTVTATNTITRFNLNNSADAGKLINIQQWGTANWTSMENAFYGASAMTMSASDNPDLAGVTSMLGMFSDTNAFNGDISGWNVASVTDMTFMFSNANTFNQDISGWNVASVTDMTFMFSNANTFNQDISGWNVARVTDMSSMFDNALAFNQDISGWNIASVTNMVSMFAGASAFNQNIGGWDVASVTNMERLFSGAIAFDQDISGWNVARVTTMFRMFDGASAFNQDIGGWNVANVTNMTGMFADTNVFNQDIGNWNVAGVTAMGNMFLEANAFNQNLDDWNVARVTNMIGMFRDNSAFNQNIASWNVASVTNMNHMFSGASAFNQNIGGWNVASVTTMNSMFDNADAFNQNLGRWYVDETVDDLQTANSDYDGVDDLNVLSFNFVAQNAVLTAQSPTYTLAADAADNARFTLDSNALNINSGMATDGSYTVRIAVGGTFGSSNSIELTVVVDGTVTPTVPSVGSFITVWRMPADDLTLTFPSEDSSYNIDWGDGTTQVITTNNPTYTYPTAGDYIVTATNTITRFRLADGADKEKLIDVQQWGTANWTSMRNTFNGASNMTMSASDTPDLSGVTNMALMFTNASTFNQDIGDWNITGVTAMFRMFDGASAFNQDIGGWDVASVTTMGTMFSSASAFNGNISGWNVANVTNMSNMFLSADAFNQDIGGWNVAGVTNMENMLSDAGAFNQNLGRWYVDETVADLQTANPDYNGVDNLNVLSFNFVAQNTILSDQNPSYALATDAAAEGSDNAIFTLESNTLSINSDSVVDGSYTVRIAVGDGDFGSSNSIDLTVVVGDPAPTVTDINDFITVWQMTSDDLTLTFPSEGSYSINWGDGTIEEVTGSPTHTYATAGDYTVTATNTLTRFNLNNDADAEKLIDIQQWGTANWTSMANAFFGARNMMMSASDIPDLAGVTDMSRMFRDTVITDDRNVFNSSIGDWNVAGVTNMSQMFRNASAFNQDIRGWNVASVTNMSQMFEAANNFDQYVGGWNVARVTNMNSMFAADNFDQDVNGWNVASVTDMTNMFGGISEGAFNRNLGRWYVDETVNDDQGMLQTVNPDYDGVDDLNLLDFNFVAQNAFLIAQNPTYTLATSGADNARFTLDSNTLSFKSGMAADGTYSVRITVSSVSSGINRLFSSRNHSIDLTVAVGSPTVTSIVRTSPTEETTSADTLIWTLTFDRNVQNVDASDFSLSGTTATVAVTGSGAVYQVSVTGGDLATLNGTVTLAFADDQNIEDLADNALIVTTPTGANQPSYIRDDSVASLSALALSAGATLDPAFASDTTDYTASVANAVSNLSVILTSTDSNASFVVSATAADGSALTVDANGRVSGLSEGANTISITVTAQNTSTVQTYTVTVTRLSLPGVPRNLTIATTAYNSLSFSWQAPETNAADITGYRIERAAD